MIWDLKTIKHLIFEKNVSEEAYILFNLINMKKLPFYLLSNSEADLDRLIKFAFSLNFRIFLSNTDAKLLEAEAGYQNIFNDVSAKEKALQSFTGRPLAPINLTRFQTVLFGRIRKSMLQATYYRPNENKYLKIVEMIKGLLSGNILKMYCSAVDFK